MKKLLSCFIIVLFLATPCFAKDVWVNGYYKSNGTYVEGHHRTSPDNTTQNNYSTQGNYSPYTGKEGTRKPSDEPYAPTVNQRRIDNYHINQQQENNQSYGYPNINIDGSRKKK